MAKPHFRKFTTGNRIWKLGTRASPLALAQAEEARNALARATGLPLQRIELVPIRTTGDRNRHRPLAEVGGKGLFSREIDAAMLKGEIDLATHSAKDLPGILDEEIVIAAALPRADPADALIHPAVRSLDELSAGTRVGTSSPRRRAQLLHRRPDLEVLPLRGNIETRLQVVLDPGGPDAALLAMAGLNRLHCRDAPIHRIEPAELLPAVGQGIIIITTLASDASCVQLCNAANDKQTNTLLTAERAFMRGLGGDCHTPIAALAVLEGGEIELNGEILRVDGSDLHRDAVRGPTANAESIGGRLAERLLARAGPGFWDS